MQKIKEATKLFHAIETFNARLLNGRWPKTDLGMWSEMKESKKNSKYTINHSTNFKTEIYL